MLRRNFFLPMLALGMIILFTLVLIRLLVLRYDKGDVYPAYSSLRADPLGARAYYEALQSTDRYRVMRGFTSLHRELQNKPNALLYLGLSSEQISTFSEDEIGALDAYVREGGRVLITFAPEAPGAKEDDSEAARKTGKTRQFTLPKDALKPPKDSATKAAADIAFDAANPDQPKTMQEKYERDELRRDWEDSFDSADAKDETPPEYARSLAALWGFGWGLHPEEKKKTAGKDATDSPVHGDRDETEPREVYAHRTNSVGIEPEVPWKSALYFVRLEPEWQALYRAKDQPVLVRRPWGKGEIRVATDSYFLSNEGLRDDRRPLLLSWLAGVPGRLLFDESHLGTHEQEGIMALAEKFRLEGFLYGMLGVLMLLIWRNSTPLVPPRATDSFQPLGGTISGKDSRSGLVNLLRRNISPSEILKVCLAEWKRGMIPKRSRLNDSRLSDMEAVVAATTDQPARILQSYLELSHINTPGGRREIHAPRS